MGLSAAERQATYRQRKYTKLNTLPKIPCACNCGELIPPINKIGKSAQYKHGHNPDGEDTQFKKGHKTWNKNLKIGLIYPNANKGKTFNPEMAVKRTATRLTKNDGIYCNKSGWKHKPLTIALMTKINASKALLGENNPAWLGGKSFEEYGIEFTDSLKQNILERDGWKCVECGAGIRQAQLVVHHKDVDKKNNNPTNLQTLCKSCHGGLHGKMLQNIRVKSGVI